MRAAPIRRMGGGGGHGHDGHFHVSAPHLNAATGMTTLCWVWILWRCYEDGAVVLVSVAFVWGGLMGWMMGLGRGGVGVKSTTHDPTLSNKPQHLTLQGLRHPWDGHGHGDDHHGHGAGGACISNFGSLIFFLCLRMYVCI